jgi:AcrR family transcriptional regulator
MAFIEKLQASKGSISFFVQSGFPESSQSHYLEAYFEQLALRLGRTYLGTAIKGGVEGLQMRPAKAQEKMIEPMVKAIVMEDRYMEVKDRIISSAYEIFSIKGYEKTTIEEIIKHADCSKGGFYHHFKSKEEILELIVSNYMEELIKIFEKNVFNNHDSFIDKFNEIFVVTSQFKLKQLTEWSKVSNIFIFAGNDSILMQLQKKFKTTLTKTYCEVLTAGKNSTISVDTSPEILAELCTRVVMWIYEAVGKPIFSDDISDYHAFIELLDFSEELVSHTLGLEKDDVKFKETALSHLQSAREYYQESKEGLR